MSTDVIIYPTGNGDLNELTVSGATYPWQCLDDPAGSPNDDVDKVSKTNAAGSAYLTFPALSIPAGVKVNYIRVYMRCMSLVGVTPVQPSLKVGGTLYPGCGPSVANSTTGYQAGYSDLFLNPRTGKEWTVDDVNGVGANALQQIGLSIYPQDYGYMDYGDPKNPVWYSNYSTLYCTQCYFVVNYDSVDQGGDAYRRPSGDAGAVGGWTSSPTVGQAGWMQCNDPVGGSSIQNTSNYISIFTTGTPAFWFSFPSFTLPSTAIINSVTVGVRAKSAAMSGTHNIAMRIVVGGTTYDSAQQALWDWQLFTNTWNINPKTGVAWTAADVNGSSANPLQAFGGVCYISPGAETRLTQAYVVVNYTVQSTGKSYAFGSAGWVMSKSSWGY